MRTTTIVSMGMDDSLRSGAMMLGAAVRGFDLDQIHAHTAYAAGKADHLKFAALHALTAASAGLHYRVFRGELRSRS
jgi:hypothetical protein